MILCIDPGAKKAGVALFEPDGTLTTAWLAEGDDWIRTANAVVLGMPVNAVRVSEVVVEKMQVYDHTPPAQANACIILSLMAGRVTGLFNAAVAWEYLPKTWKGQVPKEIHHRRIEAKLTDLEVRRIKFPKNKKGNLDVWDAIGIGLYHLRSKRREG